MDILDFLIFFLWIILFYIIFYIRRKRYHNPVLKSYHKKAFWLKVFSAFAFCIFLLFITQGDTTALYYPEGRNIFRLILKDPSNLKLIFQAGKEFDSSLLFSSYNEGYFDEESNFMVVRIVSIFSFFTFGKFMAINLFFSMFAFTGAWRLYRFFYEQYPHLHRQLAIAILFLPSFVFWSSGILKDSICIGALGWMTYASYQLVYFKRKVLFNLLIVLFFGWLLMILKIYILVSYLPFFLVFLFLKNISLIKSRFSKFVVVTTFLILCAVSLVFVRGTLQDTLGEFIAEEGITHTIQFFQTNYASQEQTAESNFSLGVEFDGTPGSLVKMAPAAIAATLYRPFLWESKKISTLLSSIESLLIMMFTLYVLLRVGIFRFTGTLFGNSMVLYCFAFAILFSIFVGSTTLNFGTLVRYKIPALPFYLIALILILDINKKTQKEPVAEALAA